MSQFIYKTLAKLLFLLVLQLNTQDRSVEEKLLNHYRLLLSIQFSLA